LKSWEWVDHTWQMKMSYLRYRLNIVSKSGLDFRVSKWVDHVIVIWAQSMGESEPTQRYFPHMAIKCNVPRCHCLIERALSPTEESDCKGTEWGPSQCYNQLQNPKVLQPTTQLYHMICDHDVTETTSTIEDKEENERSKGNRSKETR
jgi:hypothetical protein